MLRNVFFFTIQCDKLSIICRHFFLIFIHGSATQLYGVIWSGAKSHTWFSFFFLLSTLAMWIISPIMLVINSNAKKKSFAKSSSKCGLHAFDQWMQIAACNLCLSDNLQTTIRRHCNVVTIANHLQFNRIRWTHQPKCICRDEKCLSILSI